MKIIKIKFLGREYEIQAENNQEEISKIINLQERLNNRVKNDLPTNNNYSDIHRLLIVALKLENRIDDILADNKIKPLTNCNFGLSVHTRSFLKKKNIIGKVNATVKKYRAQVICNTGRSALKYFANPSIIGRIIHANKLKVIAFIKNENIG